MITAPAITNEMGIRKWMSQGVEEHQKLFSEGFSGIDKRGNYGHVLHHMNGDIESENLTVHYTAWQDSP